MKTYLVAFLLAAVVAIFVTPVARQVAPKIGAVDLPSGRRVHKRVIPRMGGVAILAGFLAPLLSLYFYDNSVSTLFHADLRRGLALMIGSIAVATLGAFDDIKGVRALTKLAAQTAIAMFAYAAGFRIDSVALPFFGHLEMGVFALPITVLWITGIINAVNLMDGLDGLAAGVSFFVCIVTFITGLFSHNVLVCLLAVSLGGALIGFLFFNFNPATIFMGDTGSMTIGYILATASLLGSKGGTAVALLVPVLAMGVPILDTLLAIVRRFIERRPIFAADKGHLHHRLLDMGLTHRRAVLAIYGFSMLFTCSAIVVYIGRTWTTGLALALSCILVFTMIRILGIVQSGKRAIALRRQEYDAQTQVLRATVPAFLQEVRSASTTDDLLAQLSAFAERSGLKYVGCQGGAMPALGEWHWEPSGRVSEDDPGYLSATYRVGPSGADSQMKFGWPSDGTTVAPETAILLQIVTDAVYDTLKAIAGPQYAAGEARSSASPRPVRQVATEQHLQLIDVAPKSVD